MKIERTTKTKKVDYNIEFAHIYADEEFGREQEDSIRNLREVLKDINKRDCTYSLTLLIDDYHSKNDSLNIEKIVQKLKIIGIEVDFVCLESSLAKYAEILIDNIEDENLTQASNCLLFRDNASSFKIKKDPNRYTCALLTAVWSLSRLGVIDIEKNVINFSEKEFAANELITILPSKYKSVENKALRMIRKSIFNKFENHINLHFFEFNEVS